MAAKYDAVVNELNFRIDKLIERYTSSLERGRELESRVQELQSALESLRRENRELGEKLKTARVAKALSGGSENYGAKTHISQLVREIDRCIALLNN